MKRVWAALAALAMLSVFAQAETAGEDVTRIEVGGLLTIEVPDVPEIDVPEVPKPKETTAPKIKVPEIPALDLPGSEGDAGEAALAEAMPEAQADPELEAALDVLGKEVYRTTWQALERGEVIRRGSRGETARGVQLTLIALGQELTADGDVGPKTLAALNAAQASLGLAKTDTLEAAGYAELVKKLAGELEMRNEE